MNDYKFLKIVPLFLWLMIFAGVFTIPTVIAQTSSGRNYYIKALNYYSGSNGCQKDYALAVENFKLAEQAGCFDGDLFYGFCLMSGEGVTKNIIEGAKHYARAASTGERQALFYFGLILESGDGVQRNVDTAKRYFGESAKKGEKKAIAKLKDSYGITDYSGLNIDWHNSERFLTSSTTSGKDYYNRAINYYSGSNGCQKDYTQAVENFKLAEQAGCFDGDLFYGFCLMSGSGTPVNKTEGAKRYARSASTGDRQALYFFGSSLENGDGVQRNTDAAKRYFGESAKKGDAKAIAKLKDSYGITDYSGLNIDWHNSERFLSGNANNGNNGNNNTFKSPEFTWISFQDNVQKPDFTFKVGVNSTQRLLESSVFVNGILSRGIKAVENDGYDYVFNPTVKLDQGQNTIKVSVLTSSGNFVSEKRVTYYASDVHTGGGDKRIALILGNADYADPSHRLPNPVNDANDVAKELSSLGFQVIKVTNLSQSATEKAIVDFGNQARNYDVALFYYAGHGVSTRGLNYIIPIDAQLPSEDAVRYKCVDVNMVLDVLESSGCPMKIMVLDACRNNPFARTWHRSAGSFGLSTMNAPKGTFISFSTAPGEVAADGVAGERNSPFTSAFLNTLNKPGLSINDFFQDVIDQVCIKTNERQSPWISSSFRGKFIFNNK